VPGGLKELTSLYNTSPASHRHATYAYVPWSLPNGNIKEGRPKIMELNIAVGINEKFSFQNLQKKFLFGSQLDLCIIFYILIVYY
jgi:hypothetical protein